MICIKIRERNENHKNDRQQRKKYQCKHGHGEQRHMKPLMGQASKIIPETIDLPVLLQILLCGPGIPDISIPNVKEYKYNCKRQHTVQQNQHRVVARESLKNLELIIPYLFLCFRTECIKFTEILKSKVSEEIEEPYFCQEVNQATNILLIANAACTHYKKG